MVKKKPVTTLYFFVFVIIVALVLFIAAYAALTEERYMVKEEHPVDDPILGVKLSEQLEYNTEFCANKLTRLITEIHFIESEISGEEEVLSMEKAIEEEEEKVLGLEEVELQELMVDFDLYKIKCEEFTNQPTEEICNDFLPEAERYLSSWQQRADEAPTFFAKMKIVIKELRIAKRINNELQDICAEV